MRIGGGLGKQVQFTKRFWQNWHKLPETLRKRAHAKIVLLQQNPAHPSLHVHQLHRLHIQVCSITAAHRLLFTRQADRIILLDIGTHDCLNRAHLSERSPLGRAGPLVPLEKRKRKRSLPQARRGGSLRRRRS